MTQQPVITRTENIVVRSTTKSPTNYLIVTDESGTEHKVSPKRDRLFPIFQPGAAVHLEYAEYMKQEYIANATPIEQMIETVKPPETGGVDVPVLKLTGKGKVIPKDEMSKDDWAEKDRITRISIERQTSLNAAVEVAKLMGVDKVTTEKIITTAKRFEEYLRGDRLAEEAKRLGATEE